MQVIRVATREGKEVIISQATPEDFKQLVKKRYSFDWRKYKNIIPVYKLQIKGETDILGVIGLEDWVEEKRIEIKLLACSAENRGKTKMYEGVAGCLIAYACRLAVTRYGVIACVSLIPKTELIDHYMQKYHMKYGGWQLYLEGRELINLLNKYYEK